MTIKELYEYAKEINREDYEIEIQYRDDGGYYSGTDTTSTPKNEVEFKDEAETVIL